MGRSKEKAIAVCHWCKEDLPTKPRSVFRTPLEEAPGVESWVVCGPGCEKRPEGAVCYDKDMLDRALLR